VKNPNYILEENDTIQKQKEQKEKKKKEIKEREMK